MKQDVKQIVAKIIYNMGFFEIFLYQYKELLEMNLFLNPDIFDGLV